jgi:FtsX-like permease family
MSFSVNERRREIGIRVALGAPRGRLVLAVLRRALRQVLVGALVGVSIAALIEQKIPVDSFGGIDVPGALDAGPPGAREPPKARAPI